MVAGCDSVGSRRDALVVRAVDVLEGSSDLLTQTGRRLLVERVYRRAGVRLFVPEADVSRDWCFGFVHGCVHDVAGGLGILVAAVHDLRPGSPLVHRLRSLQREWDGQGERNEDERRGGQEGRRERDTMREAAETAGAHLVRRGARSLTPVEIRELAQVFGHGPGARQLLASAGVPVHRIPVPEGDAETFWAEVSRLLGHGLLEDGSRRVLAAAAARFPSNAIFAAGLT
jgi:hypothetical protein